ncbi:hypothetical protein PlfCFBP13513_11830 [Plantibacter flavus]|uniref:hypothetical protein n=1 Tax=Plantibacter flavus TaxID=150123 RepID=UPI0010C23488|nr:hypothetical protein [Plantibacter flavus]TKJ99992.1 hypothetical protein PlfCFBP13513_11830 [Plantibacter flavus]
MFFQPTLREPRPRPPRTRRSRAGRIVVLVLLIAMACIAALILYSCSTMKIASWRVTPVLQEVVGDHGTVSAYAKEFTYSSGSSCTLSVDLDEDITVDETATVLQSLAPTDRFAPCDISTVETATRSTVFAENWNTISDDGWVSVAEHLAGPGPITLYFATDAPAHLDASERGRYTDFVDLLRQHTTGDRLEDTVGPVRWTLTWDSGTGAYKGVRITTDETPPAALAEFLDALTIPFQGSSGLDSIIYTVADGETTLHANLSKPDDQVTAAIQAAFAASGLPGELTINPPAA